MKSKTNETEIVFTIIEMYIKWNVNFLQNSYLAIHYTYSSQFSISWRTFETSLFIWYEAASSNFFNLKMNFLFRRKKQTRLGLMDAALAWSCVSSKTVCSKSIVTSLIFFSFQINIDSSLLCLDLESFLLLNKLFSCAHQHLNSKFEISVSILFDRLIGFRHVNPSCVILCQN